MSEPTQLQANFRVFTADLFDIDDTVAQEELAVIGAFIDAATTTLNTADVVKGEFCRDCREESAFMAVIPRADFIIWGRFFVEAAMGPKCYSHAREWFDVSRPDQYAVYDLRPINALNDALAANTAALDGAPATAAQ